MSRKRRLPGLLRRRQRQRIKVHEVPCDGCVTCCQMDQVFIHPELGDRAAEYETEEYAGRRILAHKPNGDCVYLGDAGCIIHERRPAICRELDCAIWLKMDQVRVKTMLAMGLLRPEIITAALERIKRGEP